MMNLVAYQMEIVAKTNPVFRNRKFNQRIKSSKILKTDNLVYNIKYSNNEHPITFEDPKTFDNTPQQAEKYNERSLQIATEMGYVFSKIN